MMRYRVIVYDETLTAVVDRHVWAQSVDEVPFYLASDVMNEAARTVSTRRILDGLWSLNGASWSAASAVDLRNWRTAPAFRSAVWEIRDSGSRVWNALREARRRP